MESLELKTVAEIKNATYGINRRQTLYKKQNQITKNGGKNRLIGDLDTIVIRHGLKNTND